MVSRTPSPNLFIIGAMKAGTSSLHEYLHQHPDIFMSRMKEPQYFAPHRTRWNQAWGQGNPFPEPGIDWYLRLFEDAGAAKYAGESSVSYTARPWVEECERRIHEFNPEARLIYIVRDPVDRAVSHYWQFVKDGREDLDILTAFQRKSDYLARSNYAFQLQPYLELFGQDQVFVLSLEDLNKNPQPIFKNLFDWLGIPDASIDTTSHYNVSRQEVLQTRRHMVWLDTMMKHWRWRRLSGSVRALFPRAIQRMVYRRALRDAIDLEPVIDYVRPILLEYTQQLELMLDRKFDGWSTLYQTPVQKTLETAGRSVHV